MCKQLLYYFHQKHNIEYSFDRSFIFPLLFFTRSCNFEITSKKQRLLEGRKRKREWGGGEWKLHRIFTANLWYLCDASARGINLPIRLPRLDIRLITNYDVSITPYAFRYVYTQSRWWSNTRGKPAYIYDPEKVAGFYGLLASSRITASKSDDFHGAVRLDIFFYSLVCWEGSI